MEISMTAEQFRSNLDAAASELDKVIVDVFIKYRLSPEMANYLIAELAAKIAKYPVSREFESLKSIEN